MNERIVSIQHGDYREGLQIVASGRPELYFGMYYSIASLENLIRDRPHLIISLNAPAYSEKRGSGELAGIPLPTLPKALPARFAELVLARRLLKKISDFKPTHVLIRTSMPTVVRQILRLCRKRRYQTLVILANTMINDNARSRRMNRSNAALMNEPFVFRVGNHKWPATESLVESGLNPSKAIAWDYPGQRQARDHEVKDCSPPPFHLVYAGAITFDKGVGDLINAVVFLHASGLAFRVSILGSGDDLAALKKKADSLPEGLVDFKGRLSNAEVFQYMRDATLVFVPSRHTFPEGLPLTLTEGLASRTPLVVSDHPVMVRAFRDGEGLRFFRASDPASLSNVTRSILENPTEYRHLSESTADALERVSCPYSFNDLLDQWKETFPSEG